MTGAWLLLVLVSVCRSVCATVVNPVKAAVQLAALPLLVSSLLLLPVMLGRLPPPPPEPLAAAVMRPLASTVMSALV